MPRPDGRKSKQTPPATPRRRSDRGELAIDDATGIYPSSPNASKNVFITKSMPDELTPRMLGAKNMARYGGLVMISYDGK